MYTFSIKKFQIKVGLELHQNQIQIRGKRESNKYKNTIHLLCSVNKIFSYIKLATFQQKVSILCQVKRSSMFLIFLRFQPHDNTKYLYKKCVPKVKSSPFIIFSSSISYNKHKLYVDWRRFIASPRRVGQINCTNTVLQLKAPTHAVTRTLNSVGALLSYLFGDSALHRTLLDPKEFKVSDRWVGTPFGRDQLGWNPTFPIEFL